MRKYKTVIFPLLLMFLIAGCGVKQKPLTEVKVTGNIKGNDEKRIVVTNSNAFEILIGLGASDNIVGINKMPQKSFITDEKWPVIGSWQTPNIEAIINLKPSMVLAYDKWPDAVGFDDKLAAFNIAVDRIDCYFLSKYHSDINQLASYVGKEEQAEWMISDFDKIVNTIKSSVGDIKERKRVYIEFSEFTTMSRGTGNNEMLELSNVENIASELSIQYPKISTEWLLKENPDIIIKIITDGSITEDMYKRFTERKGWDKLEAVKNKNVYLISSELCSGPRAMIGSLYISKWCYPEKFTNVNPDSVHFEWLNKYYGVEQNKDFVYIFN